MRTTVIVCVHCGVKKTRAVQSLSRSGNHYCSNACVGLAARSRYQATFWTRMLLARSGCMEWQGPRTELGYGRARFDGAPSKAHRVAWILTNGPIPAGLAVCHRCDNPPCCNTSHLFLGTIKDNTRDMVAKKRGRFGGVSMIATRLAPGDAEEIRNAKRGELGRIAKRLGIDPRNFPRWRRANGFSVGEHSTIADEHASRPAWQFETPA